MEAEAEAEVEEAVETAVEAETEAETEAEAGQAALTPAARAVWTPMSLASRCRHESCAISA